MGNGSRITISNKGPRMDIYRLMVIHWSIFTLSIQLIYCASIYSNIDSSSISNSICSPDIEHFVSSDGRESSLTLDLYPSSYPTSSCKRILTPPELHGFFIRLARVPKTPIKSHNTGPSASSSSSSLSSSSSMISSRRYGSKGYNSTTRLCPLTIFSLSEPTTTPWVIDPCQLESHADIEDPVKLMQGRLKIIWNHDGNSPSSKLIITVLGKGLPCQQGNKHPCLKFGMEALLCISKDLICDGVQHCPSGSEYNSDEDEILCSNDNNNNNNEDNIWEHFTMDVFRKFLNSDAILPTPQPPPDMIPSTTTITTNNPRGGLSTKPDDKTSSNSINKKIGADVEIRRNSTGRNSLTSDLSRYGPWGYLMLGMLLCGGALLMCGLWECCCRQNKPSSGSATAVGGETTTGSSDTTGTTSSSTGTAAQADPPPPNYDELDPPPAYAVLFPNQKAESSSNMSSSTNLTTTNATNNSNSTDSQTTNQSY